MSAELIKELRRITGAGLLDCKKALAESDYDLEKAKDWIRAKGLATASKIAGRTAAEGVAATKVVGNKGVIIEINSETDFVAKNEQFQELVEKILDVGIDANNLEELNNSKLSDGQTVAEDIQSNIAAIRENITLRRMRNLTVNQGAIGTYIHNKLADNMGRIAVLVAIESDKSIDELTLGAFANKIAMHIAAAKPLSLTIEDLDARHVEKEKAFYQEQAQSSGKPENVILKMAEGMLKKFYDEVVLLEQYFVADPKQKISQILENAGKELGTKLKIIEFIKFEVGEGIVHNTKNFADEVASITKQ